VDVPTSRRAVRRPGAVALAVVALIGSLVAFPSGAVAAPVTTVRGVVSVAGDAVAGVPVGIWSPTRGVLATGTTDARGRFALRSPSDAPVVAYAGSAPSAAKAVFAVGTEHLVRGVIGAQAPTGLADPLQQRVTRALPGRLGGGRLLRFRLQEAGRFTASSPVLGSFADTTGEIELEHGSGDFSTRFVADAAGRVTSGWLVPGRYHLVWNGNALLERTRLTVRPGTTVVAPAPVFTAGATISIHVTSGGAAVPEGVPSVQLVDGSTASALSTDATGTIVQHGFAPGTYRFTVGQYFDDPDEGLEGPPSTDDYLPRTVTVVVAHGAAAVSAAVDLAPASKLSGTIAVPKGTTTAIDVEDAAGTIVRRAAGDSTTGAFELGGLPAGSYRVFGVDVDHHRYDVQTATLPAASSTSTASVALPRPLVPATAELTVRGAVRGAEGGSVLLRSSPVHGASLWTASSGIGAHGGYRIRTIPARLSAAVLVDGAVDRTFAATMVTTSLRRDFPAALRLAAAAARFAVQGHVVRVDVQALGSGGRQLVLLRAARGRSTAHGVTPGTYSWSRSLEPLPATDGPWYYSAPTGSFTLRPGTVAHLGTRTITILG
jgi:hypothetical protein